MFRLLRPPNRPFPSNRQREQSLAPKPLGSKTTSGWSSKSALPRTQNSARANFAWWRPTAFPNRSQLMSATFLADGGDYFLQIRDFRFQGSGAHKYRINAGALPYLESIFPFGGQRGKQVEVALSGRNLEGTSKMTFAIAPTSPLGRQEIRAN